MLTITPGIANKGEPVHVPLFCGVTQPAFHARLHRGFGDLFVTNEPQALRLFALILASKFSFLAYTFVPKLS